MSVTVQTINSTLFFEALPLLGIKMKKAILISALFMMIFGCSVHANPNFLNDSLSEQIADQIKAGLKVKNDPEIIEAQATYIKSFYDALIKQGLTKEEALKLVAASLSAEKVMM
jgi:hypothetical protein